jgi:hypothetical protein
MPLAAVFNGTQTISCEKLPNQFSTYQEAIKKIKSSRFKINEKFDTSKSSWISSASFYSCDGNTGYFILIAKGREYIHSEVPYIVWEKFKTVPSLGIFYTSNIKNKYTLPLKN